MKQLPKRLFTLLISLICLVVIFSLSRSIVTLWQKRDIVRERSEALKRGQAQNAKLKAQLEEAQTPLFIEREARDKLGLAREGEAVVLMPGEKTDNRVVGETSGSNKLLWKRWWNLFF